MKNHVVHEDDVIITINSTDNLEIIFKDLNKRKFCIRFVLYALIDEQKLVIVHHCQDINIISQKKKFY